MKKIKFNPTLDALAQVTKTLFDALPNAPRLMRLEVDFKDANGRDRNIDTLVQVPNGWDAVKLAEHIQSTLPDGCILSAIFSVDTGSPIFVNLSVLKECFEEQGLPIPEDLADRM